MARLGRCVFPKIVRRQDLELNFKPGINVLFGANGNGKTTILKTLHSALSNDLSLLKRSPVSRAVIEIDGADGNLTFLSGLRFERRMPDNFPLPETNTRNLVRALTKHPESDRWIDSIDIPKGREKFKHIFLPISRMYFNENTVPDNSNLIFGGPQFRNEDDFDKNFAKGIQYSWLQYTRNLGVDVQIAQSQGLRNLLYDFLSPEMPTSEFQVFDPRAAFNRLLSLLKSQNDFDSSRIDESSFMQRVANEPRRMSRVVRHLEETEERVESLRRPRIEVSSVLQKMMEGKDIELQDRDIKAFGVEKEDIELQDLSSGEKQLLRILIDVLLADGEPIIIDEPEMSLHIDWQRALLGVLTRLAPNSQVIVATHSPEIMANVSDSRIMEI